MKCYYSVERHSHRCHRWSNITLLLRCSITRTVFEKDGFWLISFVGLCFLKKWKINLCTYNFLALRVRRTETRLTVYWASQFTGRHGRDTCNFFPESFSFDLFEFYTHSNLTNKFINKLKSERFEKHNHKCLYCDAQLTVNLVSVRRTLRAEKS